MLFLLFLLGLALPTASQSEAAPQLKLQRGSCPMFWYGLNGRCFKYVATQMTWADAELHCVSQNANLVSIHSLEEEIFVRYLIKNFDHHKAHTWIGLSDAHKEGRWMWTDGSAVNFTFWHNVQPDNYKVENCVHNNYNTAGKWNDGSCSIQYASVCVTRSCY